MSLQRRSETGYPRWLCLKPGIPFGSVPVTLSEAGCPRCLPPRWLPVFADVSSKEAAVVAEIERVHASGQPVLLGTESIEVSERLACLLDERNIGFQLLNGKQDAEEVAVVARAGQLGAVTIATNMAGRGTDIKLGRGVADIGGLHVIAASAQESPRVDRQLIGRAARQGEPGSSQVFVSAEDCPIKQHAPKLAWRIQRQADRTGEVHADLTGEITAIQCRVECKKARQRQQMFAHDDRWERVLDKLPGHSRSKVKVGLPPNPLTLLLSLARWIPANGIGL